MKPPIYLLAILLIASSCNTETPILKIGLVADPQYADAPTAGKRHYRESLWKLQAAIDTFNLERVDIVQTLGDVIDKEWSSYDSILPIYKTLDARAENYHLLGNHDFSIDSVHHPQLLERLSMPGFYYSYLQEGWRFIVLDATDYAYFSNSLHLHSIDSINTYYSLTEGKPNHQRWNSAIGEEQKSWLQQELDQAKALGQKVILFSHMPLRPLNNAHNIWNDGEIIEILEHRDNVVAFINGHNHAGNYVYQNGIHYITVFGMVDTSVSSFGILEIYKDHMVLKGYGNQQTQWLELR